MTRQSRPPRLLKCLWILPMSPVVADLPRTSMSSFHDPEICRCILESLPAGLCVVDMEKKIVFWSDGAERITGHLRHEVIGHSCTSETLLHCEQPDCEFCSEDCPVTRSMKTSHPADAIGVLHHKSGYEVPVRIRAVPVHNQHGSIIGAVETFEELQPAASSNRRDEGPKVPGWMDEDTNVASPTLMRAHLRETLTTFAELRVPFGVICLRLEGLTHFRASLGPEAGSSLLRVVARSLESTLSTTDVIGRWSDDQFLLILNGCRDDALPSVCERVRRMLGGDGIEWWGERRSLPFSIGRTTGRPGDTVESLIERVQQSLQAPEYRIHTASASGGTSGS
jgi:diguanylate cyclase (GGDEF)-like protein/PAS domain S-box-containing protein